MYTIIIYSDEEVKGSRKRKIIQRECKYCHDKFKTISCKRLYCNNICKSTYYRKNNVYKHRISNKNYYKKNRLEILVKKRYRELVKSIKRSNERWIKDIRKKPNTLNHPWRKF